MHQLDLLERPRRNRQSSPSRSLIKEHRLTPSMFITPLFLIKGEKKEEAIPSMPHIYRLSLDFMLKKIEEHLCLGLTSFLLFAKVQESEKDPLGSVIESETFFLYKAIYEIKRRFPETLLFTDLALDPYTSHGHDGILEGESVHNDKTVLSLSHMALNAARSGSDYVAPSDMMDGRVGSIRKALDKEGFTNVGIMSYTAKYASCFYAPFRAALDSAPSFGDKKGYQMDPANVREAVKEAILDEREGADLLLIKPALCYLDVLSKVKERTNIPVGAYVVSGEYAMMMAAAEKGLIDKESAFYESALCIRRAGASFIVHYGSNLLAKIIKEEIYD